MLPQVFLPNRNKHLSQSLREHIANQLSEDSRLGDIAKALSRNKSTLSREFTRNSATEYQGYTHSRAHARIGGRKTTANTHERLEDDIIRQ